MTDPVVVPVGRYLGLLPVTRSGRTALEHLVRVGGRRVDLSDDEHLAWALAHGMPGSPDLRRWTRAAMRRHLPQGTDVTDLDGVVDRLVGAGLLLEVGGPAEEFARAVRLLPQAVGLGNGGPHSRTFGIGFPGSPLATVPTEVFYLWSWAGLEPDLWTACRRGGVAAGPATDPGVLAAEVLRHVHALLSVNVACLDRAS